MYTRQRLQLEIIETLCPHVRRSDGVSVPGYTKHPIRGRLDDERVRALCTMLGLDDILDSAITSVSTSDTWAFVGKECV